MNYRNCENRIYFVLYTFPFKIVLGFQTRIHEYYVKLQIGSQGIENHFGRAGSREDNIAFNRLQMIRPATSYWTRCTSLYARETNLFSYDGAPAKH